MVSLVQLVEHQIVVLGVVGSSPTGYPKVTGAADKAAPVSLLPAYILQYFGINEKFWKAAG